MSDDNATPPDEPTEQKQPPEDVRGRTREETLDGEPKQSGVRRIRARRVVVAAGATGLVACLALGYGLTPPRREARAEAVRIDVRRQQGELPNPPVLSLPADVNYATETRPPEPTAHVPKLTTAAPPALSHDDVDGPPSLTMPPDAAGGEGGAGGGDEPLAEMRRQQAALSDALKQAQERLDAQMEQARSDLQAQREQAQASLDAPIGFTLKRNANQPSAQAGTNARQPRPTDADLDGPLNPLVVAPNGGAAINPNEVQPRDTRSNLQTEKIAFLNSAETGLDTYLRTGPTGPVAMTHELSAGTVVPGFTVTAINSDLPGKVVGRVSADVYDSATGRHVLIPQGSVAVGEYSSLVSNGQNRLLVAWEMMTFPDGRSVDLKRQPGTDAAGASGLADRVDYHWRQLLLAGGLSTAVAVGGQLAEGDQSGFGQTQSVDEQLRKLVFGGTSDTASRIADKIIDRQLDVQPTITVRPGWKFRILLTRNLVLEPYVDSRK